VETREAVELLAGAVPKGAGVWADFGAGDGTFTRALGQLLGPGARIYAVDRDARVRAAIEHRAMPKGVRVIPMTADFTEPCDLSGLAPSGLDGMLFANALHFVLEPGVVVARLVARLRPGGRVVIVEYDGRPANRWVPYPIPVARLPALAAAAGLTLPALTATRPSAYGGILYVAMAERPAGATRAAP
jgi:trans-aconitate methyltransferase